MYQEVWSATFYQLPGQQKRQRRRVSSFTSGIFGFVFVFCFCCCCCLKFRMTFTLTKYSEMSYVMEQLTRSYIKSFERTYLDRLCQVRQNAKISLVDRLCQVRQNAKISLMDRLWQVRQNARISLTDRLWQVRQYARISLTM